MKFESYVQNLAIANNFKEQILNKDFRDKNPIFYQNYPSLFSNIFEISNSNLNLLDIAGYLYYQATLFTDSLIDEKDLSKFPLITICQEESIKILTSIFGLQNNFWVLWNSRKQEYFEAIFLEKELSKKQIVSIDEYENLADKKAAFGKVAIDCLLSLDNKGETIHEQLLLSHRYFSVAFQLNDDIQDFKDDIKKRQFNWAVYILQQQNISTQDINILQKYLYIRGVSKQIYQLGIDYCDKSLWNVKSVNVPEWKLVIEELKKNTFKTYRRNR